jgi:hypothetical protein
MALNRPSHILTIAFIALVFHSCQCFVAPKSGWIRDTTFRQDPVLCAAITHETEQDRQTRKLELLDLLKETPSNAPTSRKMTREILEIIDDLEKCCPTPDEQVLESLAGNWELLWTTQDKRSHEWRRNPLRAIIK